MLGLGSRTTSYYLSVLNALYNKKKGAYSSCPSIVYNVDFNTINPLLPNVSEALDAVTQEYLLDLESFKTEYIIIPNVTLHETVDRLTINASILHPIPLTISKIKQNNYNKIILFASLHSMTSDYITSSFKAHGIDVVLPSDADMSVIDEVRVQVYNHTETSELIEKYHCLIQEYSAKYPVVLGCTELSILNSQDVEHVIDMAQIQMEAAIACIS